MRAKVPGQISPELIWSEDLSAATFDEEGHILHSVGVTNHQVSALPQNGQISTLKDGALIINDLLQCLLEILEWHGVMDWVGQSVAKNSPRRQRRGEDSPGVQAAMSQAWRWPGVAQAGGGERGQDGDDDDQELHPEQILRRPGLPQSDQQEDQEQHRQQQRQQWRRLHLLT